MRISTRQLHDVSINSMLDRQADLSKTQLQMSTGKRVLSPSDDPVASTQILGLQKNIDITTKYQENISYIKNRLGLQEGLLNGATNVIQRVRELAVQANNTHMSDSDRVAIAGEVRQRLEELIGQANAKDANGEYLFGGFRAQVPPINYNAASGYTYAGDDGQRELQIGPSYFMKTMDNGEDTFMRIRNGNGTFVTKYDANNTGTGIIDSGQVYDNSVLTYDDYQIDFLPPALPFGPVQYTITDTTTGTLVVGGPPAVAPFDVPQDFVDGQVIQFTDGVTDHGIQVTINGDPQVGDIFTVTPARSQDIFTTIENLITTMETAVTTDANYAKIRADMGDALQELDNGLNNILDTRAELGARLNAVDSQEYVNEGHTLQMEDTRSKLEDLDYAEATGRLNRELTGLQAAQQVYQKVQGLNLFDFIR